MRSISKRTSQTLALERHDVIIGIFQYAMYLYVLQHWKFTVSNFVLQFYGSISMQKYSVHIEELRFEKIVYVDE